ncbi:MAG TPA: hypothetical protein VGI83_01020 [Gemmatimonadales bacterium]
MSDTLQTLGGLALIGGLLVAYIAQRVAARRPQMPPGAPPPDPPPAEAGAPARSSVNWGAPFIYCALLSVVARGGQVWSIVCLVVYAAFVVIGAHSTFSPRELAAEQRRRSGTTRGEHYLKLGVPYVLVPVLALALVLSGAAWAILLPAVPWVLLLVLAVVVLPVQGLAAWMRRRFRRAA